MYENKEEALRELNKIIDEYGIGFSELKENYSSGKTVNTKKKNKVRIRLLSFNEAILKLLVPYGNKQNIDSYSIPPWKISEGKYGLRDAFYGPNNYDWAFYSLGYTISYSPLNKITSITSNLYQFANCNTNLVAMTTVAEYNIEKYQFAKNGYGLSYQDNYEDKPEIRVKVSKYNASDGDDWNSIYYLRYSRNGEIITRFMSQNYGSKIIYKSNSYPYAGLWPVMNI